MTFFARSTPIWVILSMISPFPEGCVAPAMMAPDGAGTVIGEVLPIRDQACRDVTHSCPGGHCRPRETLVPGEVQWVSQNRGCCLAQRQSMVAHRPGDPVIRKQAVVQREDPIRTVGFRQSRYWARSPCTTAYPKQRVNSNRLCFRRMA